MFIPFLSRLFGWSVRLHFPPNSLTITEYLPSVHPKEGEPSVLWCEVQDEYEMPSERKIDAVGELPTSRYILLPICFLVAHLVTYSMGYNALIMIRQFTSSNK